MKFDLLKFIESLLKHSSTRKDDKLRLLDCKERVLSGEELDLIQQAFINSLRQERQDRQKRYTKK